MRFEEALRAMREGHKIRLGPCRCFYQVYPQSHGDDIIDYSGDSIAFDGDDLISDKWEVVNE